MAERADRLLRGSHQVPRGRVGSGAGLAASLATVVALAGSAWAQPAAEAPPRASAPASPAAPAPPKKSPATTASGPSASGSTFAGATPRRAVTAFLRAAEAGELDRAAELLDLRGVPPSRRAREGIELASMLHRVLVWSVALRPDDLPDEADPEGAASIVIETLDLGGVPVPIALERTKLPGGELAWRFSGKTVAKIRPLYEAQDRRSVEERMPDALTRRTFLSLAPWQWLGLPALLALSWIVARATSAFAFALGGRLLARLEPSWLSAAARAASPAIRLVVGLTLFVAGTHYLMLPPFPAVVVDRLSLMVGAIAGAWVAIAIMRTATRAVAAGLPEDTAGELENRGLRTRLVMIERVVSVAIGLVAVSVVLLQFEVVRTVGLSLLASAGIAGIVLGIAAQRTLGGVIGGIELAFTQPLRIGDTVVLEGEYGTVEAMYFTYVVLRCWDDRRLIVPVTRLLTLPFQNLTRSTPEMLVTVELHADHRVPVATLRTEAHRLCAENELCDGRVVKLQVVEANDRAVKLRLLASVDNCEKAFDLRCQLREAMVAFLQQLEGGRYLPRQRVESPETPSGKVAPDVS